MPANFKDYPLYVYDDPAIYNTFSGGINTNPNNEHLDTDEVRDCLNMTYNSAGLIKRPGAKQLCTIVCDEELFNIQGVFIFTYKISYLIVASNGKLYYGLYNENIKINLTRLYIYSTFDEFLDYKSPLDMTIGLDLHHTELENQQHNGYICRSFFSDTSILDLNDKPIYNILEDLTEGDTIGDCIVKYNNTYRYIDKTYTLALTKPGVSYKWVEATDDNISENHSKILNHYKNNPSVIVPVELVVLNDGSCTFKISPLIDDWKPRVEDYLEGEIVNYNGIKYICIERNNYLFTPISEQGYPISYRDSLVFQNKQPIEVATYDNKLYIATGTRFCEVYLLNNRLQAFICTPYECSFNEISSLGPNLLSPYPEYCATNLYNQIATTMSFVMPVKNNYGTYVLTPVATYANDLTEADMVYKWEKYIDGNWHTIISYADNYTYAKQLNEIEIPSELIDTSATKWQPNTAYTAGQSVFYQSQTVYMLMTCLKDHTSSSEFEGSAEFTDEYWNVIGSTTIELYSDVLVKHDYSTLTVTDADTYKYRVSMCELLTNATPANYPEYDKTDAYIEGDIVYVEEENRFILYKCVSSHIPANIDSTADSIIFSYKDAYSNTVTLWKRLDSSLDTSYAILNNKKLKIESISKYNPVSKTFYAANDFVADTLNGSFGQASTTLYTDASPHSLFETIHSCCNLHLDGNKLLLYNDAYNSGMWFKTKLDNPYYISTRGCLSFKTTKNEQLIKVKSFSNNLIAFATTDNIGGSIHLVTGNGDDYDQDDYYSPYKRVTITESFTCNNPNTVQVCENYLFFKYFNTVYFIVSSELSNDVITIYSANDNIKLESPYLTIPWDDNDCISEATEDYYALIWKEKYSITNQGLMLDHPAMKLKLYYKMAKTSGQKVYFPWLRDESKYFNTDNIIYIKGKPVYLYNNLLVSFDSQQYKDIDEPYKCLIHFRGVDTNYPKLLKVLSNVIVYYYHRPTSGMNITLKAYNEAGNTILDSTNQKRTLQNLRTIKVGTKLEDNNVKTDYVTVASKVFNTTYKFPYLLVESILEAETDDLFALSSMTYIYTSMDTPDSTMYDTYTQIIRKKEI